MIFDWYLLFNLTEFMATGLVSRNLTVSLEGIGDKEVLITRGNEVSLVFEDVMMPIGFEGDNSFIRQGDANNYAVYKDTDQNVYLGIEAT